jgi:tRNA(Ile)-lysidine synthase
MQAVKVPKGKYVLAVSGGVDSMALLDMLRRQSGVELVVAHVNHGIRSDSAQDEKLVHSFCMSHNILFMSTQLHLGAQASEEVARKARYNFLQHCRNKFLASKIITAHHQDDLIETVVINLLRGTGWRGLAPFGQTDILRPLIETPKSELLAYAKRHHVPWREDSTNSDQTYRRNYVRHTLVPYMNKVSGDWKIDILRRIRKQQLLRRTIEKAVDNTWQVLAVSEDGKITLPRHWLIMLPNTVAYELMQAASRQVQRQGLLRDQAEAALLFAKVAKPAKKMLLNNEWQLRVTKDKLIVERRSRVVS